MDLPFGRLNVILRSINKDIVRYLLRYLMMHLLRLHKQAHKRAVCISCLSLGMKVVASITKNWSLDFDGSCEEE